MFHKAIEYCIATPIRLVFAGVLFFIVTVSVIVGVYRPDLGYIQDPATLNTDPVEGAPVWHEPTDEEKAQILESLRGSAEESVSFEEKEQILNSLRSADTELPSEEIQRILEEQE